MIGDQTMCPSPRSTRKAAVGDAPTGASPTAFLRGGEQYRSGSLADRRGHRLLGAIANHGEVQLLPDGAALDGTDEVLAAGDGTAADLGHHVTSLQTRGRGRAARGDLLDLRAAVVRVADRDTQVRVAD